jgi:Thiol-activated cytolysin
MLKGSKEITMKHAKKIALFATMAALSACGNSSPITPSPVVVINPDSSLEIPSVSAAIQQKLNSVDDWDTFAAKRNLIKANADNTGTPQPINNADGTPKKFEYPSEWNTNKMTDYTCEVNSYDLTRTPEKVVSLDPDSDVLWPGSLIQGGTYGGTNLGSMRPLAFRDGERAPTSVSLNLTDGSGYAGIVSNPALSTTRTVLGGLVQTAKVSDADLQRKSTFLMETSDSLSSSLLKMGLSVNIASKVGLDANASVDRSKNQNRIYVSYLETAFTANVDAPASPSDLFTDKFTQTRFEEYVNRGELGPNKPILYVSGVTYGRLMIMEVVTEGRREEIQKALNLSIQGAKYNVAVNLSKHQQEIMNSARVTVKTWGGNANGNNALINAASQGDYGQGLKAYFNDTNLPKATQYVPISYAVRDTISKNYASISETTKYDITTCTPKPLVTYGYAWKMKLQNVRPTTNYSPDGGLGYFGSVELNNQVLWKTDDPQTNGKDLSDDRVIYGSGSLFQTRPLSVNCKQSSDCEATVYTLATGANTTTFNFAGEVKFREREFNWSGKKLRKNWGGVGSTGNLNGLTIDPVAIRPTQRATVRYGGLEFEYSLSKTPMDQQDYETALTK